MNQTSKDTVKSYFDQYINEYDVKLKTEIWEDHSKKFVLFWDDRILNEKSNELSDHEIDEIVRILDRNGKGNTKANDAIAKVMIPQGVWRRMFNELKKNERLSKHIDNIFNEQDKIKQAMLIDELYQINEGKKNHLTGQSGNAINSLLAAFNPFKNLSIVSIKDRLRLIEYLNIDLYKRLEKLSIGEKIVQSNFEIIRFFNDLNILHNARTISEFCYSTIFKPEWKSYKESISEENETPTENVQGNFEEKSLFYMESHLEDFLIKNWEKTELGKKYDLIEEDGDLVSQQYITTIGRIDILAKEKKTGDYVIIELKKDQTSDQTVGQLTRYMGWVEEKLSGGKPSKGLIIAADFDEKLHYAIRKVPGVEVFTYKIEFKLDEFKKIELA